MDETTKRALSTSFINELDEFLLSSPLPPSNLLDYQQQMTPTTPEYASLRPVSMSYDDGPATTEFPSTAPSNYQDPSHHAADANSSTAPAIFSVSSTDNTTTTPTLAPLLPMSTDGSSTSIPQMYLAIKLGPENFVFTSDSSPKATSSTAVLANVQFPPVSGSIKATSCTTVAPMDPSAAVSSSWVRQAAESSSLQPAAHYLQPVQPRSRLQYIKVDLPASISMSSSATPSPSGSASQPSSNVSTSELAHSINSTTFHQSAGSAPASTATTTRENSGPVCPSDDQCLAPESESNSSSVSVTQRLVEQTQCQAPSSASTSSHHQSVSKDGTADSSSGQDEMDQIYIDTKELCYRVAYELKTHNIQQGAFAERVIKKRGQGAVSELLRDPTPWNKSTKSGRETYLRMYTWLQQPLEERLSCLKGWKTKKKKRKTDEEAWRVTVPSGDESAKKTRVELTDIQRRALQAIFEENQMPDPNLQRAIANHLNLSLTMVQSFFMKARRRWRSEHCGDSPTPRQLVRPITPPSATTDHYRFTGTDCEATPAERME